MWCCSEPLLATATRPASSGPSSIGQESTILALGNTFYHWGGIIVPPGYTDAIQFKSGNPYGTSHVAGDGPPGEVALQAARFQARRVVEIAAALNAGHASHQEASR